MLIETQLTKDQFVRISILRHFQRKQFYFYAITCALVTVFAVLQQIYILLAVAWLPFLLYIGIGVYGAISSGSNPDHPAYLPTKYKFTNNGVTITNAQGESELSWQYFTHWKVAVNCYLIELKAGSALVIPQSAVAATKKAKFEALLDQNIG